MTTESRNDFIITISIFIHGRDDYFNYYRILNSILCIKKRLKKTILVIVLIQN